MPSQHYFEKNKHSMTYSQVVDPTSNRCNIVVQVLTFSRITFVIAASKYVLLFLVILIYLHSVQCNYNFISMNVVKIYLDLIFILNSLPFDRLYIYIYIPFKIIRRAFSIKNCRIQHFLPPTF